MRLGSYAVTEKGRLTARRVEAEMVRHNGRPRLRVTAGDDFICFEETAIAFGPGDVVGLRDARLLDLRVQRATRRELAALRGAGYDLPRARA